MKPTRQFEGKPREYDPEETGDPYEKFKAHMQYVDDRDEREIRAEWDDLSALNGELWTSPPKWSRWWRCAIYKPCRVCFYCAVFALGVFAVWAVVKVYH